MTRRQGGVRAPCQPVPRPLVTGAENSVRSGGRTWPSLHGEPFNPSVVLFHPMKAAGQGSGAPEQCAAHAQGRLQFGMEQSADVLKAWLR